ncbi:MAG: hypothetical protein IPG84_13985 [Betaproteobacteria bacterium]|nr:hypothetical protein [Betaproteobacteria bacterium]
MTVQARAAEVQALASERRSQAADQRARSTTEYAPVAQIRAELENAKWELSQTTVVAP